LKNGERWVRRIQIAANQFIIENNLKKPKVKIISFLSPEDKKLQRNGIDAQTNLKFDIEIKTRYDLAYYNVDILLEKISVVEQNKLGWLSTSKADFVAYVWATKKELKPIGYLIDLENLRKSRIYKRINSFEEKTAYSDGWSTLNAIVPIHKFPKNTLYRFNPNKIPINDISNWG